MYSMTPPAQYLTAKVLNEYKPPSGAKRVRPTILDAAKGLTHARGTKRAEKPASGQVLKLTTLGRTKRSKSAYASLMSSAWLPALKAISTSSAKPGVTNTGI